MAIVGLFLAALMGLSLGLLGGGGSILAVPILKYALSFGAKEAIASRWWERLASSEPYRTGEKAV